MLLNRSELFELIKSLGHKPSKLDFPYTNDEEKAISLSQFISLMNEKINRIDEVIYDTFRLFGDLYNI